MATTDVPTLTGGRTADILKTAQTLLDSAMGDLDHTTELEAAAYYQGQIDTILSLFTSTEE